MDDAYIERCRDAFHTLKESIDECPPAWRVSVMNNDGGAFHRDFKDMAGAVRMFNANVQFGCALLVCAFTRDTKSGWAMVAQYPQD